MLFFFSSCAIHENSNIKASEILVVEVKKPETRGGLIDIAIQGLYYGVNYLAQNATKSLTSNYSQSISINDYYNNDLGYIQKTYNEIQIKKYAKVIDSETKKRIGKYLENGLEGDSSSNFLPKGEILNGDKLLNFYVALEIISDEENPGISKIKFKDLRVLFSKTKVYSDENLNMKLNLIIEGQWRGLDGSPTKKRIFEYEYVLENLKYGFDNQIKDPIISEWYYDIPISSDMADPSKFGLIDIKVELVEYEGGRAKYINKLPSILEENKSSIIHNSSEVLKDIIKN